jgi:hypothetical protein
MVTAAPLDRTKKPKVESLDFRLSILRLPLIHQHAMTGMPRIPPGYTRKLGSSEFDELTLPLAFDPVTLGCEYPYNFSDGFYSFRHVFCENATTHETDSYGASEAETGNVHNLQEEVAGHRFSADGIVYSVTRVYLGNHGHGD